MSKKFNNFVGCGHSINAFVSETTEHIKVKGHIGLWYVIDRKHYENVGTLYLCEHETYGDETSCVIIDKDYNLIIDDVWNGFDDYEEAVDWENYQKEMFSVIKEHYMQDTFMDGGVIQHSVLYKVKFEQVEYEVMLLETVVSNKVQDYAFFYNGNRPTRYGILEEKLKEYYITRFVTF